MVNNGTVVFASAKIANGADFESSGSDQWFEASDANSANNALDFATDFSISFWVKFESLPSDGNFMTITSRRAGGHGYSIYVVNTTGTYSIQVNIEGTSGNQNATIITGTFYHFVIVYNKSAGTAIVYQTGSSIGTISSLSTSLQSASAVLRLGWDSAAGARYLDGILDEVGFWIRALTSGEATRLYGAGTGITTPFELSYTTNPDGTTPNSDSVSACSDSVFFNINATFSDNVGNIVDSVTTSFPPIPESKHNATWTPIAKS